MGQRHRIVDRIASLCRRRRGGNAAEAETATGQPGHGESKPAGKPGGAVPARPATAPGWLLRRADQGTVAVLILFGLLTTIAWWWLRGGPSGEMVELEQADWKTARFEVDINAADWPELLQLPQIGETLAKRIVESRRAQGPFRDPRDLLRVRGIGPRTLELIRPHLRPIPDQGTLVQNERPASALPPRER